MSAREDKRKWIEQKAVAAEKREKEKTEGTKKYTAYEKDHWQKKNEKKHKEVDNMSYFYIT